MMPYELEELKAKELEDNKKAAYPKIANTFIENVITNSNENALKIVWFLSMNMRENILNSDSKISTYRLKEKEIIKETGLDIRTIMKYLKSMMKTTITFVDEEKKIKTFVQLIPQIHNNYNGTIDYDIYNIIAKLIVNVTNKTSGTYVDVRRLLKLQNKHSIRLLPQLEKILTNNNGIAKKKNCDLRYLNSLFGTKYKRYSQIIKFILEDVKKELDNNSSLTFDYFTIRESLGKRGKPPITSIDIVPVKNKQTAPAVTAGEHNSAEPITKAHAPLIDFSTLYDDLIDLNLHDEYDIYVKNSPLIKLFYKYIKEQIAVFKQFCIDENKNYKNIITSFKRHLRGAYNNNLDFFATEDFIYRKDAEDKIIQEENDKKIKEFLQQFEGKKLCEYEFDYDFMEDVIVQDVFVLGAELYVKDEETKNFIPINDRKRTIDIINSLKKK